METGRKESGQVMLYGYVYGTTCNSEVVIAHTTRLVNADVYQQEVKNMETELHNANSGAKIKVGNSKYDYGPSAKNMCMIKWQSGTAQCKYWVTTVSFGKTQQEALDKAMKKKNDYAARNAEYSIVEEKYW